MHRLAQAIRHHRLQAIVVLIPFLVLVAAIPFIAGWITPPWHPEWESTSLTNKPLILGLLIFQPVLILGMALVPYHLGDLQDLSPDQRRSHQQVMRGRILALTMMFSLMYAVGMLSSLGWMLDYSKIWQLTLLGVFFYSGNSMTKVQPTRYLCVLMPWAAKEPETWRRTHRATGYLMVGAILALLPLMLVMSQLAFSLLFLGVVLATSAFPFAYSYWLHKSQHHA